MIQIILGKRIENSESQQKQNILDHFNKNPAQSFTLTQLEAKFQLQNLVTLLNDLLSQGEIIQVKNHFRLPYGEEKEEVKKEEPV
jgi:hypothetical protein